VKELADIGRNIGRQKKPPVSKFEDFVTALGKVIQQAYIKEIQDLSERSSLSTGQSIVPIPKGTTIVFEADYQFKFIDEGVNALPAVPEWEYTRPRVTNSPYSFRIPSVSESHATAMANWADVDKSAGYAMAMSSKKHGLPPKLITENVWNEYNLEQIEAALLEMVGVHVSLKFER
jgi:hypothetical protein